MTRFQMMAISLIVAMNALDGFDVLSVSFAVPGIARQWSVPAAELGILISMGLVGMSLGSFLLPPIADRLGRRPIILGCLVIQAVGMFSAAFSPSLIWLCAARGITGIGIGGLTAAILTIASEYANLRNRALFVSLMGVGYPLGGMIGGAVASLLLHHFSWRSIFILGGLSATVLLPFVWKCIPESLHFLLERRPSSALARVNSILNRMGHPSLSRLPVVQRESRANLLDIFHSNYIATTLTLSISYLLFLVTFYFFLAWLPKFIVDFGVSPSTAATVSAISNVGGVIAGVGFGAIAPRIGLKRLAVCTAALSALAVIGFGQIGPDLVLLTVGATLAGALIIAGAVGFYALIATAFPTSMRATGAGFCIGVGRFGGIAAPVLSGGLLSLGYSPSFVCGLFGSAAMIAAFILGIYHRRVS